MNWQVNEYDKGQYDYKCNHLKSVKHEEITWNVPLSYAFLLLLAC